MPLLALILLITLLGLPLPAFAYDVLVLQSSHDTGYAEAVNGLKQEVASTRTIVLSDFSRIDIGRMVREEQPKVIVAVGDNALNVLPKTREVPVVYLMAFNPKNRPNQTGVTLFIDPARYLALFSDKIRAHKIGVIYDPAKTGPYLKEAQAAAKKYGVDLVAREVHAPKETPRILDSLHGKVDAVWMLPDLTAVSQQTTEAYFYFSQQATVPVVAFSDYYLSLGAAYAVSVDKLDMGRQAGEMAKSILLGTGVDRLPPQSPRKTTSKANVSVLMKLKTGKLKPQLP